MEHTTKHGHYRKLPLMLFLSLCIMYLVMFLNVDSAQHIYLSTTRLYMSLLMVAPMPLLMLIMMPMMYPDKKINLIIYTASVTVFVLSLLLLRTQTPIGERQYMKAMIPHHSSAVLTSKHANLQDPDVKELAEKIIRSQEEEIAQMKAILDRMDR
ncbi:DUF305 domain-containing protein [Algoriphagus terrigena]|uniref:DUF305 domain-containing protein n=1 Tax=Algoriphagus terrigena TaxID=344884 RepID=UPI000424F6A2|nr:DUF305 domain-containing protein [Algoriphagus terrigena]